LAFNDLLAPREFELGTTKSFASMGSTAVLAPHKTEDLANSHPGARVRARAKVPVRQHKGEGEGQVATRRREGEGDDQGGGASAQG
jgi:hypothetical protein